MVSREESVLGKKMHTRQRLTWDLARNDWDASDREGYFQRWMRSGKVQNSWVQVDRAPEHQLINRIRALSKM